MRRHGWKVKRREKGGEIIRGRGEGGTRRDGCKVRIDKQERSRVGGGVGRGGGGGGRGEARQ